MCINAFMVINERRRLCADRLSFSGSAAKFFLAVFDCFNARRWPDSLAITNRRLLCESGLSPRALLRGRDELIEIGLLNYQPGQKGLPGTYSWNISDDTRREIIGEKQSVKTEDRPGDKAEDKSDAKVRVKESVKVGDRGNAKKAIHNKEEEKKIEKEKFDVDDAQARAAFLDSFFSQSNGISLESLCKNLHTDLPELRTAAEAAVNEWALTGQTHSDMLEARRHLINHLRIKLTAQRRAETGAGRNRSKGAWGRGAGVDKSPADVNAEWANIEFAD